MSPVLQQARGFRFGRCGACRNFWVADKVHVRECPSCTFRSVRCKDCGGEAATLRSVMAHVFHFFLRAKQAGGHDARLLAKLEDGRS